MGRRIKKSQSTPERLAESKRKKEGGRTADQTIKRNETRQKKRQPEPIAKQEAEEMSTPQSKHKGPVLSPAQSTGKKSMACTQVSDAIIQAAFEHQREQLTAAAKADMEWDAKLTMDADKNRMKANKDSANRRSLLHEKLKKDLADSVEAQLRCHSKKSLSVVDSESSGDEEEAAEFAVVEFDEADKKKAPKEDNVLDSQGFEKQEDVEESKSASTLSDSSGKKSARGKDTVMSANKKPRQTSDTTDVEAHYTEKLGEIMKTNQTKKPRIDAVENLFREMIRRHEIGLGPSVMPNLMKAFCKALGFSDYQSSKNHAFKTLKMHFKI